MTRAMKDSGVAWIGEIPHNWAILRGKDIFTKRSLPAFESDEIVTCFRDGQVTLRKNRREDGFTIALKEHGYQGIRVGDLVVHAMDAFAGAIGISESNGKCSPVYSICRAKHPTKTDLRFYSYVLRDMALNGYIQSVGQGIRERSTDFRFREVEVAFYCQPTLDEQRVIADYLDQQTTLIDQRLTTLAEKKAVLAELRKATIHEAVTKGLNKAVLMKDSGVVWIGEIPQGWKIKRMKDCFIANNRSQPNNTVLSLSYGKVIVKDMDEKKGVTPESYDSYQGVHPGDVILRLTDLQNDQKSLRVGRATTKGIITSAYLCVSSRSLNDRYSAYLLHDVGDIQKLFYGLGGGVRQSMKFADLAELLFSLPPLSEQLAIAEYLDQQTQQFDAQLATLEEQAQVLKEIRKAIIHEAVTGKIDLSSFAPPQPQQAQAA